MNASKTLLTKGGLTLGAVAILATAGAASASAATVPAAHHVYPLKAVTGLYDRPDSGGVGNWANDAMTRTITFTYIGRDSAGLYHYVAQLSDLGGFTTIPGAYTPNQGAPYTGDLISGQVSGSMSGKASFEFTSTNPIDNHNANLGVPRAEFGAAGNTEQTTSAWYEQAFPQGTVFGGLGIGNWGWNYKAAVTEYKYVKVEVMKNGKPVLNPKTHKPEYKTVKVSYVLNERWADTSAPKNDAGQLPAAGNILGQ
jgi:hypothetical protein